PSPLSSDVPHRDPLSFPTRRSSDLSQSFLPRSLVCLALLMMLLVVSPVPGRMRVRIFISSALPVTNLTARPGPTPFMTTLVGFLDRKSTRLLQSRENLVCRLLLEKK